MDQTEGTAVPASLASVASELVRRGIRAGHPLRQQALHKLAYLVDAHHWAATGRPGIDVQAKAWQYGPHYPDLLAQLEYQGNRPIRHELRETEQGSGRTRRAAPVTDPVLARVIDHVWNAYGLMTGPELSAMTSRTGLAWDRTRSANPGLTAPGIPGEEAGADCTRLDGKPQEAA